MVSLVLSNLSFISVLRELLYCYQTGPEKSNYFMTCKYFRCTQLATNMRFVYAYEFCRKYSITLYILLNFLLYILFFVHRCTSWRRKKGEDTPLLWPTTNHRCSPARPTFLPPLNCPRAKKSSCQETTQHWWWPWSQKYQWRVGNGSHCAKATKLSELVLLHKYWHENALHCYCMWNVPWQQFLQ